MLPPIARRAAIQSVRLFLCSLIRNPEIRKVELANPVVVNAIRPRALASQQEDRLHEAWRAVASSTDSLVKRVEGFKNALARFDKVLVAQVQIAEEDKRMTAACEAFRNVLTNR